MTTASNDPAARRRRVRRRVLIAAPSAVAALALATLSAAWKVERDRLATALDGAAAAAARGGVRLALPARRITGFPFRLRVQTGPVSAATASGWEVRADTLVAQAFTYDPLHWVLSTPNGLTVMRAPGQPLVVRGAALRASVAGVTRRPWRVVLEGDGLRFTTPGATKPFPLASADRLGLYLKPAPGGPAGDGAVLLDLRGAHASQGSVAWSLAPGAPFDAAVEGRLIRLGAFSGRDWGEAVRAWRDAGGALRLGGVEATGGGVELWARGGELSVGADGRLAGAVPLRLRQAPRLIYGPPGAQSVTVRPLDPARREAESASFDLRLKAGEVRLGPVLVGPAPKVG